MFRLMLLRHAKAAPLAGGGDKERPLTTRGHNQSAQIGQYLKDEQLIPDAAIVSDTARTRQTLSDVLEHFGGEAAVLVQMEPHVYDASPATLLKVMRHASNKTKSVLLVGHNPGIHQFAVDLIGYGDRYAAQRLASKYPTAALTVIDFDIESWREVQVKSGRLDRFVTSAHFGEIED
ncbi:SixA phosphatase family protein [Methylovirgula sp. 4M-Z18]|uniref:SixA phosphatase family protein n=1 Tax=Methylovirgula sp. 4M-Z18 TaxID=2293567 RepID=UPI000E2F1A2B|nr:histidine phosphatase family protein [Methylovirgula sp. 4M-Z18]RFB78903.1 histidine phosphatase family protein [Methylovirgula sp. 4M-Z18]